MGATIKERLATLETKVDQIQNEIIDIKSNHLASINKKLRAIEDAQKWKPKDYVTLISSIGALLVTLVTSLSL